MTREELDLLIAKYVDGVIDPAEAVIFLKELDQSEEARLLLARHLYHERTISNLLAPAPEIADRVSTPRRMKRVRPARKPVARRGARPSWGVSAFAAAAAALLVVTGIIFLANTGGNPGPDPEVVKEPSPAPKPQVPPVESPSEIVHRTSPDTDSPAPKPPKKPEVRPVPTKGNPVREPAKVAPDLPLRPAEIPPPPAPKPARSRTEASFAMLERAEGRVFRTIDERRTPAENGQAIVSGQALETAAASSRAVIRYPDESIVELGADTVLRQIEEKDGKRAFLARGSIRAEAAKQPRNQPMIFTTPHGEAIVLGTALRLTVVPGENGSTRLEVEEGRVRLRRAEDRKHVDVTAGHFAVIAPGVPLRAERLPITEILLLPRGVKSVGGEWKLIKDPLAAGGFALEADKTRYAITGGTGYPSVKTKSSYLVFSFTADSDKDYHVWIRGRSPATANRQSHDEVAIEPANARFSKACTWLGPTGDNAYVFNGYYLFQEYGWIGGHGEGGRDQVPISIRFNKPGRQTLRMYALETPIRIDAVWLSTTQNTRPPEKDRGPVEERR